MRRPVAPTQRPRPRRWGQRPLSPLALALLAGLLLTMLGGVSMSRAAAVPRGAVGRRGRIQGFAATLYCAAGSSGSSLTR